jgi:hypothetical protein
MRERLKQFGDLDIQSDSGVARDILAMPRGYKPEGNSSHNRHPHYGEALIHLILRPKTKERL